MLKMLIFSVTIIGGVSGCATAYYDSAPASNGGRYVAGSFDNKRAMFFCKAESSDSECEKVRVNIND